jgi:hypothetical protein
MQISKFELTVTFSEPVLGTTPMDEKLFTNYIATKKGEAGDSHNRPLSPVEIADELETLPHDENRGKTGFHRLPGTDQPMVYNYWLKGFCKDACQMLRYDESTRSKKLKAFKKVIDGTLFVMPRRIPFVLSGPLEILERPLRAQTMQGERVALAYSEIAPAGTAFTCQLHLLGNALDAEILREWLDYGALRGFGAWRNAGWGAFTYTLTPLDEA